MAGFISINPKPCLIGGMSILGSANLLGLGGLAPASINAVGSKARRYPEAIPIAIALVQYERGRPRTCSAR